ncbi:type II toxin-antitoxin system prevent-host-death family antitoxin [Aeromicrobium sp.]|uniref:type II toxin-antitoxin system prevent-host-death family antitoxin n=1 Tax=Aeromicrobium sp. TaxID=1871063 RepID=UPI0039E53747
MLGDLVDEAAEHEVFLLRPGRPVGVLVSVEAYEAVQERIDDLEDRLSLHEPDDEYVSLDEAFDGPVEAAA